MNDTGTRVEDIPRLDHDDAMRLAAAEYDRVVDLAAGLAPQDWSRQTDCPGWDVKAVLAHLVGMMRLTASPEEAARQFGLAAQAVAQRGGLRIDALTALQVAENVEQEPAAIVAALRDLSPAALAGRRDTTEEVRAAPHPHDYPNEPPWTRGYLLDVILTRDPWMHRVDICRATGRTPVLTPDHDGRLVADVVAEWARRHGRPFTLLLDGPAGGCFTAAGGGPSLQLDAVEFCRLLSGRGRGEGLLAVAVPF